MYASQSTKSIRFLAMFLIFFSFSFSPSAFSAEQITVKPGQTLMKIMRQVYPDQRSRWPKLMREIVQSNPAAFENGDPRTLKVGATISLPEESTAKPEEEKRYRAATVASVSGSVTLFDDKKQSKALKPGDQIFVGDQLLTSDVGQAKLLFIDGATMELRCNSLLNIEAYKMRTRGSQVSLSLLKGSLATKTGRIGKRGQDQYTLKTPVAVLKTTDGEYGVRVHQARGCGNQADVDTDGLYLAVLNGSLQLQNDAGQLGVSSGDAALATDRAVAPAVYQPFSGMVFGDKIVEKPVVVKSRPIKKEVEAVETEDDQSVAQDDGVPYWWMIAAAVILGITF